jgi:hypothetical protein
MRTERVTSTMKDKRLTGEGKSVQRGAVILYSRESDFPSRLQRVFTGRSRGYTKSRNTDETCKVQAFLFDLPCKGGDWIVMPSRDLSVRMVSWLVFIANKQLFAASIARQLARQAG